MLNSKEIRRAYKRYGFEEQKTSENGVLVFTIKSGHFHNADIVVIDPNTTGEKSFSDFKASGYAPKIRNYESTKAIEDDLFKGFFSIKTTRDRLRREYQKYTSSLVSAYSNTAKYSYIDSSYTVNGKKGESKIIDEITSELESDNAMLVLIEAAAGFGKTCSAYELVKYIVDNIEGQIPLFSELSRNRQAKIFRYVLLDEIDRTFPVLSSRLVLSEIENGSVPVILDGFDELLHRSKDQEGYDNAEPMLETIGELLRGSAKVILTTRRTAIFDGDEFHDWMASHKGEFKIVRIRISEPSVREWLPDERFKALEINNFPISRISNPVLLSYLRSIDDQDFEATINDQNALVDRYFQSMMEREQVRQDLRMSVDEQSKFLTTLAKDMIACNYTSESREYITSLYEEYHKETIEEVRLKYGRDERPTVDELINKLASHALLDRETEDDKTIGFVNEFALGNYCAENIINENEWTGDEIFIEPSVISYIPRTQEKRERLYNSLKFCLEFLPPSERISTQVSLLDKVEIQLSGETVESLKIRNLDFGINSLFEDCVFVKCTFVNVYFHSDVFENVSFLGCSFYSCQSNYSIPTENISFLGCTSDNDFVCGPTDSTYQSTNNRGTPSEKYILEKFWPIGRPTFYKHRPIKGLTSMTSKFQKYELDDAIISLLKKELIMAPEVASVKEFAQLNVAKLSEIISILERE